MPSSHRDGDDRVNVAVLFPAELHEQVKRRAAEEDLSLSQLLRRLARDYVSDDRELIAG